MRIYHRKRFDFRFPVTILLLLLAMIAIGLGLSSTTKPMVAFLRTQAQQSIIPFQSFANTTTKDVGDFFGAILDYKSIKSQNIRLRSKLHRLQNEVTASQNTKKELSILLSQLKLPFAANIPKVVGEVVSRSTTNFSQTIEINKGSSSGLKVGMPVVSSGGLIGRLIQVSASRSVAILIQDPKFYVGVRFVKNSIVGLAKGQGYNNLLSVEYVGINTKIFPGELVVTSGLQNSVFPPGIPVGKVVSARVTPSSLSQQIKVKPLVNTNTLEFVSILKWK